MKFEKGQPVRQKVFVVSGNVLQRRIDPETDKIQYFLRWKDAEGNDHERWWNEDELEATS